MIYGAAGLMTTDWKLVSSPEFTGTAPREGGTGCCRGHRYGRICSAAPPGIHFAIFLMCSLSKSWYIKQYQHVSTICVFFYIHAILSYIYIYNLELYDYQCERLWYLLLLFLSGAWQKGLSRIKCRCCLLESEPSWRYEKETDTPIWNLELRGSVGLRCVWVVY